MNRAWKFGIFGVLALILIAGAGLAPTRATPRPQGAALDVLRLPNSIADGAHVADEKGFFAKHGIRIEWTGKQAHGPAGVVSVVAGQNDAAGSISTAMIIARGNGSKLKIVAASGESTQQTPLFRYLVKDGSKVSGQPADFVGKKVVANPTTITWYPLVVFLKRAGIDHRKVEFVSLPSPLATEQALRQGKVDVVAGSETMPPGSKLLAEGGVHALPGLSDYEVLGIKQIGGWVMREDFIQSHPDTVRRFVAALAEGYQWANQHPVEAREIINRRNEVPQAYRKFQGTWRNAPPTALVDEGDIRKWIAILEEFDQIPRGSVKPEDVFTNALNPHAPHVAAEGPANR